MPTFEERIRAMLQTILWPNTTVMLRSEDGLCLVQLDVPGLGQTGFWMEEKTGADAVDNHELYDYLWRRTERELLRLARKKCLQEYRKKGATA